jgi:hypothetical protein
MERLPETIKIRSAAVAENPDLGTLKQVTAEARYLARYLKGNQVQALNDSNVDLELALCKEARCGLGLNTAAEL